MATERPTDTEMLDWLDGQRTGYGEGILWRMPTTGRGWRLHETSKPWCDRAVLVTPRQDVRDAIADAMLAERERKTIAYPVVPEGGQ